MGKKFLPDGQIAATILPRLKVSTKRASFIFICVILPSSTKCTRACLKTTSLFTGTYTVQFYDGVIRCVKRIHIKSMPEDAKGQVSDFLRCPFPHYVLYSRQHFSLTP